MTDQAHHRILDLRPVFGVEARVTTPSEATGGAYVEMDCTAEPGSGTMVHYHRGIAMLGAPKKKTVVL